MNPGYASLPADEPDAGTSGNRGRGRRSGRTRSSRRRSRWATSTTTATSTLSSATAAATPVHSTPLQPRGERETSATLRGRRWWARWQGDDDVAIAGGTDSTDAPLDINMDGIPDIVLAVDGGHNLIYYGGRLDYPGDFVDGPTEIGNPAAGGSGVGAGAIEERSRWRSRTSTATATSARSSAAPTARRPPTTTTTASSSCWQPCSAASALGAAVDAARAAAAASPAQPRSTRASAGRGLGTEILFSNLGGAGPTRRPGGATLRRRRVGSGRKRRVRVQPRGWWRRVRARFGALPATYYELNAGKSRYGSASAPPSSACQTPLSRRARISNGRTAASSTRRRIGSSSTTCPHKRN